MIDKEIATRLKKLVREKKLTYESLAAMTGNDKSTIGRYCRGELKLKSDTAELLADGLGVRKEYLLGFDDFKTESDIKQAKQEKEKLARLAVPAALGYFKSLGYSLRPCYVWETSMLAAAQGYKLLAPFFGSYAVYPTIPGNKAGKSPFEALAQSLFAFSEKLDYSVMLSGDNYFNLGQSLEFDFSISLVSDGGICSRHLNYEKLLNRLGTFELSENPIENADFRQNYLESLRIWQQIPTHFDCYRDIEYELPALDKIGKITKSTLCSAVELSGFLKYSRLKLCYALEKAGTVKKYIDIAKMNETFSAIDSSALGILAAAFD